VPAIETFLWFDREAEEAAALYTSVFPNSRIGEVTRYGAAGPREDGLVMTVGFELDGRAFTALNGGPEFPFTEAVSISVLCETQAEIDAYTAALLAGGGEQGPCGWLRDRFGLSWQIDAAPLRRLLTGDDEAAGQRAMAAMLQMRKLDIAAIEAAAAAG
jgi:predicted 3-demethylubiquinone-9 3-methyltransferase (glyoxalase superfamily)